MKRAAKRTKISAHAYLGLERAAEEPHVGADVEIFAMAGGTWGRGARWGAALMLLLAMVACGGENVCEEARNHLLVCGSYVSDWDYPHEKPVECPALDECPARCVLEVDCEVFKDAFSGNPGEISKGFRDCVTRCSEER